MLLILNYIIYIVIFLLMIPVGIFFLQVVAALFAKFIKADAENIADYPPVAILMPAHDESLVIAQSIESVKSQLRLKDRLVVVADNCADDTAAIASKLGADVVERFNQDDIGKGYALDFGLKHIATGTIPEVIIIVDADCTVERNAIQLLARSCSQENRPIQALYLMESQPNPSIKARIASFAWLVKNMVRPLGFKTLGLPCQLMGTGMAFTWQDINSVSLASGHIVEDMKLGADLAQRNKSPMFLSQAVVTSVFPPSDAATNTQRARWEHGHLSVILSEVPKLIVKSIKSKNMQMFALACDLLVPPLAVLALLCIITLVTSMVLGEPYLLSLSISLISTLLLAVLIAWFKFGRSIVSFSQLCYVPIYILIKIPLYLKFLLNRQVEWVRSKRD